MIKRIVLVLFIVSIPSVAFAQIQLGPTAYYNHQLRIADVDEDDVVWDTSNFSFGADARLKLGLLQGQAVGLYTPPSPEDGVDAVHLIDLHTNVGLAFDILMFRFGAGLGPSFAFEFGDGATETAGIGTNARVGAEVGLGGIAFALNYLMRFPFDFQEAGRIFSADKSRGHVGASVLFSL